MITTPIQIRFSDIDIIGHVNNALLQQYFDIGKSSYFIDVLSLPLMWKKRGFVAATTSTTYLKEVFVDDKISVVTSVEKIGTKSLTISQEIKCEVSGDVKVRSSSVLVAFDIVNHLSIPVPDSWREMIISHEGWNEK